MSDTDTMQKPKLPQDVVEVVHRLDERLAIGGEIEATDVQRLLTALRAVVDV